MWLPVLFVSCMCILVCVHNVIDIPVVCFTLIRWSTVGGDKVKISGSEDCKLANMDLNNAWFKLFKKSIFLTLLSFEVLLFPKSNTLLDSGCESWCQRCALSWLKKDSQKSHFQATIMFPSKIYVAKQMSDSTKYNFQNFPTCPRPLFGHIQCTPTFIWDPHSIWKLDHSNFRLYWFSFHIRVLMYERLLADKNVIIKTNYYRMDCSFPNTYIVQLWEKRFSTWKTIWKDYDILYYFKYRQYSQPVWVCRGNQTYCTRQIVIVLHCHHLPFQIYQKCCFSHLGLNF